MKTARLIAYGIGGMLAGLLLENAGLRLKAKASRKARHIKKSLAKAH